MKRIYHFIDADNQHNFVNADQVVKFVGAEGQNATRVVLKNTGCWIDKPVGLIIQNVLDAPANKRLVRIDLEPEKPKSKK